MARSFRGEHGRPFGTVAAMLCILLTLAQLTLWDVARDLTGSADPFHAIAAQAHPYWGVLLASEIVKCVTAAAIALAVWTLARPIAPRSPRLIAATVLGLAGALLLGVAAHWYIEAAAWLESGRVSPHGATMGLISSAALICLGLWAGLVAIEARRARSLPTWVQGAGLLTAAAAIVAALLPWLAGAAAAISLVWWGGIVGTLYRPEEAVTW